MKRNVIKKLGIVIMSAIIAASPVVTPFTTMTVYAEEESVPSEEESEYAEEESEYAEEESVFTEDKGTIAAGESFDKNTASGVYNAGTIGTNEGSVESNNKGATIDTNANGGNVKYNFGTIGTNEGFVSINSSGIIETNKGSVDTNIGGININAETGSVKNNGGMVVMNYGNVERNDRTISSNYGSVENNTGSISNNFTTIDGKGTVNGGTVTNQWYEVKLENNSTDLKIKGNSIRDINKSGYTDVFAKQATSITIYSANPAKIVDAIEGDIAYVKNEDGTITINDIQSVYRIITILADKILESAPTNNESGNKEEVVIEISEPVAPAQAQIATPAGAVSVTTVVAENPVAAIMAAIALQNNPVVVEQAQALAVHMETVNAAYKEAVVKELEATPNQAIEGSVEYEAKQTAIVADLTGQLESFNKITVQSLAVLQKVGVSVATGGCTKLEAANVSLLKEILTKGIPVSITYAVNGKAVTIKIPAGLDITRFIGIDGKLDLTKLRAYIVR